MEIEQLESRIALLESARFRQQEDSAKVLAAIEDMKEQHRRYAEAHSQELGRVYDFLVKGNHTQGNGQDHT